MRRTFILCSLILCCICATADNYDKQYFENATVIQLEKAGTLSKVIGKDVEEMTVLQIRGEMSDKDMKTLAKLTNLRRLHLRHADISQTHYFPSFSQLEVLFLPSQQHLPVEYLDMVPTNTKLKVLLFASFLDMPYVRFTPFASLEKVIITKVIPMQRLDYKNHGVISGPNDYLLVDTLIYLCNRSTTDIYERWQQFRGNYVEEKGHLFYESYKPVDISTLQAVRKPENMNIYEGGKTQKYIMRPPIPKVVDLQKMTYIENGYFNDTEVEEITFSAPELELQKDAFRGTKNLKKIKFANSNKDLNIPSGAFATCPKLDSIVFDRPITIESNAFGNSNNVKEVIFNERAIIKRRAFYAETNFGKTESITKVVFNKQCSIESEGFQYVDTLVFNILPTSLAKDFAICKNIIIPNEQGAFEKFTSWGINSDYLIDPTANLTFDIVVTEPGNILTYLPIDKLQQIKSLTITGHIYETDLAIIRQCINLQYLNLANAYISESPTSQERRQSENEMWAAMANLGIADAQLGQATGQYTKKEMKQQVARAVYAAAMMQAQNPDMPDCYIPAGAFKNMRLIEVVLPTTVKQINNSAFSNCLSLKKIDLGNTLVTIGKYAFEKTNIEELKVPATLKEIGENAFDQVSSLKLLDLSQCIMERVSSMVGGMMVNADIGRMSGLEVFYMPQGLTSYNDFITHGNQSWSLKDVYVGKDVKEIYAEVRGVHLHFRTDTAPQIVWLGKVENCTIYVPKGANITSYYATFNGNGNKIIQE